jgi:hypothetical protein
MHTMEFPMESHIWFRGSQVSFIGIINEFYLPSAMQCRYCHFLVLDNEVRFYSTQALSDLNHES